MRQKCDNVEIVPVPVLLGINNRVVVYLVALVIFVRKPMEKRKRRGTALAPGVYLYGYHIFSDRYYGVYKYSHTMT